MSNDKHALIAYLNVDEKHRDEFFSALQTLVENSRSDEGCLQYDLHEDENQLGAFMIFEIWQSKSHWQQHDAADHLKVFKKKVAGFDPKIRVHHFACL